MKIDFPFESFNERYENLLSQKFLLNDKTALRVHPSAAHALTDIVRGLGKMFLHKRQVQLIEGNSALVTSIMPSLSQEAFQFSSTKWDDLKDVDAFAQSLSSEIIFCLSSADNALTGQSFDISALHSALNAKKVFHIQILHLQQFLSYDFSKTEAYTSFILNIDANHAISIMGSRLRKLDEQCFASPALDAERFAHLQKHFTQNIEQDKAKVLAFENAGKSYKAVFPESFEQAWQSRIYDRAVIQCLNVDASAVQELLAKKMQLPIKATGQSQSIESLSMCRWNWTQLPEFLINKYIHAENLANILILDQKIIGPNTANLVEESCAEIQQLQTLA